MDELLQQLLEAEVLSEETKTELETAMKGKLDEAVELAKSEAAADVRAELTEQWIQERDTLIEAIDSKVDDYLTAEIAELKEDIDRFRDLEAEYAENLVEAKAQMSDELKGDLSELVEKLDAFLEIRLNAEMEELHEDITEVKKNTFGRKMFEAMVAEYAADFADDDSLEGTLRETESRLSDASEALEEAEQKVASMERKEKMADVLAPLSGRSQEVMEAILKNVPTEQLDEGYKTFIGRVLKETTEETVDSEKEDKVLAESTEEVTSDDTVTVVTGDTDEIITEGTEDHMNADELARIRKLAGLV